MGDKYTISELAKLFNITTNKIRFYEKKGLLNSIREKNEFSKYNKSLEYKKIDKFNYIVRIK